MSEELENLIASQKESARLFRELLERSLEDRDKKEALWNAYWKKAGRPKRGGRQQPSLDDMAGFRRKEK